MDQLDKVNEMQDMLHEVFEIPPTSSFVDVNKSGNGFDSSIQHNKKFDKKTSVFKIIERS